MDFRNTYLQTDIENMKNAEANRDVSDSRSFNIEFDFIERYADDDGVWHIKTVFNHDDIGEYDLWEVFDTKDGSNSLELLLQEDI
ncbi:MAG: hypothetical protein MR936_05165 [Eubacterium sp.]|nr:hypothetical protein [Eubacterium sp.]